MPKTEHYQPETVTDGFDPPTPLERLPQSAQDIFAAEENVAEQGYARYEAHQRARDAKRVDIADINIQLVSNERAAKPSAKLEERLLAKIAKAKADLKAMDQKFEEEKRFIPGSMAQTIRDFLTSPAASKTYVSAGTTDTLLDGRSPADMVQLCRDESKRLLADRNIIMRAAMSEAEIRSAVVTLINRNKASLSQTVGALKRVAFNERRNIFVPRDTALPETTIVDGVGVLQKLFNGGGLFLALFHDEVIERLTAMTLANHDESKALDMAERTRRLRQIDAAILANQYKAEYWHRYCVRSGINPGPRAGGNALAVLDIVEA